MLNTSNKSLFDTEKEHMEKVYDALDKMKKAEDKKVTKKRKYINSYSFEDHDRFMEFSSFHKAVKNRENLMEFLRLLFEKPYFAHVEASIDNDTPQNYYLSDSEYLNDTLPVGESDLLLPFKKDEKSPVLKIINHWYAAKTCETNNYETTNRFGEHEKHSIIPSLMCEDNIRNRNLLSAYPIFSSEEEYEIDADEYLAEILEKNRNDPAIKNIISSLQRTQFEIISADTSQSFVVQGCAGSGKSECMLHRLFYLREELSRTGWDKVVLITPTQLFRRFSAELIRRFNLSSVKNCSISQLYYELLLVYDSRFKSRQYIINFSEEYLPDTYLKTIYSASFVQKIIKEIITSIRRYVKNACNALGENTPEKIDISVVNQLINQLDDALEKHNATDSVLSADENYQNKRKEQQNLSSQISQKNREIKKCESEMKVIREKIKYNDTLNNYNEDSLVKHNKSKLEECISRRNNLETKLVEIKKQLSKCESWIRSKMEEYEGEKIKRTINKKVLKKSKNILSHLEIIVFEKNIWDILLEIKQKNGVDSFVIEPVDEKRKRETKILYKSDLLFYLQLYAELYPEVKLPDYLHFCIDEAQDLHKADYQIIKKLFPHAVLNLFGDTAQVLHTNCGINNWEKETGISKIYSIVKNYRNNAAIVRFCNQNFGTSMQSVGKIEPAQIPELITSKSHLKNVLSTQDFTIILKDRASFDDISDALGNSFCFEFIDSNTEKTNPDMIPCYTVFAAKGLEFSNVIVVGQRMTKNQKVVACTRAMKKLYYFK